MKVGSKAFFVAAPIAVAIVGGFAVTVSAGIISVQNNSFENPVVNTAFLPVSLSADHWVLSGPGPFVDFMQGAGPQNSGTGIFPNPSAGSAGHLTNIDGNQAAYIFTNTGHMFAQALVDTANGNAPVTFAAGQQYTITAAVANAGSAPAPTDQLLVGLYYTDPGGQHLVAQTIVQNDAAHNLSATQFTDFSGISTVLAANSPAIGHQITAQFSTIGAGGSEFDVDNIRVSSAVPEPASLALVVVGAGALFARRRRAMAR